MTYKQIISKLYELENKDKVILKEKKFGIIANNSLGIYHKDLKEIAKEVRLNNELAIQLFDSGIYEARILCSKIFNPKDITESLMEKWVVTFENWEICDSFCMGLFAKGKFAIPKALEWSKREREFEKRAGFVIMASYCMVAKHADNKVFGQFFPIIKREVHDERIYVKKAVNWALRNIGKRNIDLNKKAIEVANEILKMESKSAKWIAKDALRELKSENINILDYPRKIFRK
ncbi:MAG: DNA alkylation repair protein [Ignavibacteriae bacterium]|nr:DNA alkylation repair protein [Ignavibacteriota bacterium]